MASDRPAEADALDGVPLPQAQPLLIGQHEAERALLESYRSGRMHHAWILAGSRGIGKATLAFRFARFVLAHPEPDAEIPAVAADLSVPSGHKVAHQVAGGAHTDLVHLRRPWDDDRNRFKTELPVDEVRRAIQRFSGTAGEGGWRICIVDAADDMNANAANALLKALEEPPPRALFLLVSHMPGRLLPTIRSRCRILPVRPLAASEIARALADLGLVRDPDDLEVSRAATLAGGSLRRAIVLLRADGVAIWSHFEEIVMGLPDLDRRAVHRMADHVTARGADEAYLFFLDFLRDWLSARVRDGAAQGLKPASLAAWSNAFAKIDVTSRNAAVYNLDRRQVVLDAFRSLADAARNS